MSAPVVVGVDGSPSSMEAVEVAAREARMRGTGLKAVRAFDRPGTHVPLGPSPLGPVGGGLRQEVELSLAEAVQRARSTVPGTQVTGAAVAGEPLAVLEAQSKDAVLVVVGSRGLGGFSGLLLGSTAVHLSARGRCPVMVVRGRPDPAGPVLLGVDGSPEGAAAVAFAFAEASLRGTDLVALHAWNAWRPPDPGAPDLPVPPVYDADRIRDEEERVLTEALAGRREEHPDLEVHRRLLRARTRQALIDASGSAQLVVVGARGRGGFAGLLLGSVSQALLHHAHCPVAVVRPGQA
ncbi:universal stress protein [Streptomyces sp. HB2AG]|uniref:universal stress protein n=1 Tax=Streptomyces sp. HB2AG TaxID=2983400 RepID=UPI0022AA5282|nr:universal stress protein [Streptomyces sp. HB2AG]MCZ2524063.1 universal stress protein [Streptomyces sp. HB2AG]